MSYEGKCGKCENYSFTGNNSKGYCSWYKTYYYPDDSCTHQKNRYEPQQGCYLTTIICNKLGYSDDCFVLNSLRSFRDNVMQKNIEYKDMLMEYDTLGPVIAQNIANDKENNNLWQDVYNKFLIPVTTHIMNKEYEMATSKYKLMYTALKDFYSVEDVDLSQIKDVYDQKHAGHGKIRVLKKTTE